ncbi:hypothetical protein SAMN07250955_101551 [Arboricoccus pini]|uniref:Uncharacterized protein n=1 Tax=Arboricoccus pini TaxID=1963835 RepID=A0A212QBS0_9PROT|nr:hypothetical protein SAMN07250955_101551 [Arboricoccus pini]
MVLRPGESCPKSAIAANADSPGRPRLRPCDGQGFKILAGANTVDDPTSWLRCSQCSYPDCRPRCPGRALAVRLFSPNVFEEDRGHLVECSHFLGDAVAQCRQRLCRFLGPLRHGQQALDGLARLLGGP